MERSLFAGVHINKKRFQRDIDLFQAKGSHAAGPTSTSKLGDILDYFKTASIKPASALDSAPSAVSANALPGGRTPPPIGGTELGVGIHGSKKKRKRILDQSKEGDLSEAVHLFHRKQKSAKQKEAGSESKAAAAADIEAFAILRKKYQIHVSGQGIPPPLTGFGDLRTKYGCKKYILRNLAEAQYQEPSPIQRQAIPALLEGRECFACAPTGSGKTMAFLIPLLIALKEPNPEGGVRAVILCPTRELAQQSARELKKICKGTKFKVRVMTKGTAKSEGFEKVPCDVLISTPLRLNGMIKEGKIDLSRVMHLVLDEADKLFEYGFVDQIDAVIEACTMPGVVRSLYSATLPETVEELARSVMEDPIRITVGERNGAAATVKQRLVFVGTEEGKLLAIRQMFQQALKPPILLFVQSKERAQQLYKELIFDGIKVDVIHADRTQTQREAVVERFRLGKTWVLIATDIMSRGMDFKGVACVINYDFPQSTLSYVHRIGRSGRAGRPGEAVTLYTNEDRPRLKSVANVMLASGCEVPQWILDLPKERKQRDRRRGGGEAAPPKRKDISTVPRADRMKAKQRREMIEASKRRKAAKVDGGGEA